MAAAHKHTVGTQHIFAGQVEVVSVPLQDLVTTLLFDHGTKMAVQVSALVLELVLVLVFVLVSLLL